MRELLHRGDGERRKDGVGAEQSVGLLVHGAPRIHLGVSAATQHHHHRDQRCRDEDRGAGTQRVAQHRSAK